MRARMNLVSFDALRTAGLPGVRYIKPEDMYRCRNDILAARGVLFPEYWQVNALVFGLDRHIFPSLPSYLVGHDKVEMTRCFQMIAPNHVPFTLIEPNTPDAADQVWDAMPLPYVAKIPRSSMGQGVFLIEDRAQWRDYLAVSPVIYAQEYLPIDRDLRVIWVGKRIVASYWRLQSPRGFYNNIAQGGEAVAGPVPVAAKKLVHRLATQLGIDHGGLDIAFVGSHPFVIEFNRLFGNQGIEHLSDKINRAMWRYLQDRWNDDTPRFPTAPGTRRRVG